MCSPSLFPRASVRRSPSGAGLSAAGHRFRAVAPPTRRSLSDVSARGSESFGLNRICGLRAFAASPCAIA
jgi:hypothetical protein